jgi:hypothetical protein
MSKDHSMNGKLNDILPEMIGSQSEEIIQELVKRKMTGAARLAVDMFHAMEERFGAEARDVVSDMIKNRGADSVPQGTGDPRQDLRDFCDRVERGCAGTHRWKRIIDEPNQIGYEFTRCMWAEVFSELGEPELGMYYCASDEPTVKAYNDRIGMKRTKTIVQGDKTCDHIFYIEDRTK